MSNPIGYIDATVNTITGCEPDFECWQHCWARRMAKRLAANPTVRHRERYDEFKPTFWPERVPQLARGKGKWIAVNFMSDMFAESVRYDWQLKTFCELESNPHNVYLILTKRPKLMRNFLLQPCLNITKFRHVFFGVSVSCQHDADERLPILASMAGIRRWVSIEPQLEPVCLPDYALKCLYWVVCGPETGPGARPWNREWAESLRRHCEDYRIPFWLKNNESHQEKPDA